MRDVDVLVVGGGPAGLATAHAVAAAGLETLVVERQETIGRHVRTSGCTALATPERVGAPAALRHELPRLRFATAEQDVVVPCARPLCVLDVRGFYRFLAGRAEQAGAEILTRARATGPLADGGCRVETTAGAVDVRARVVVDAGGYRAAVSKAAGVHPGFARFGVGAEVELGAPAVDQDEAVIVLSDRFAPAGYGWLFPWGGDRARLGVGVHHVDVRNDPRRELRALQAHAERFRIDLGEPELREHHFGMVPAQGPAPSFVADGVLAVGDAAGQATLVVGEGIRIALVAGELAGETIVRALAAGDATRERLLDYERRFRAEFGGDLRTGEGINRRLARLDDAGWNAALRLLRVLPADIVVDVLESRIRRRRLLAWLATHPTAAFRSRTLARAAVGL